MKKIVTSKISPKIQTRKPKLKQPKIIIFGEKWCPFCRNAKLLAEKMTKDYKFVSGKSGVELKKLLKSKNIPKTIPQITVNGKHIGGFTNLELIYLK